MLVGDKVSGVIAIQDYERVDVYDQGHLEILTTIASQASVGMTGEILRSDGGIGVR